MVWEWKLNTTNIVYLEGAGWKTKSEEGSVRIVERIAGLGLESKLLGMMMFVNLGDKGWEAAFPMKEWYFLRGKKCLHGHGKKENKEFGVRVTHWEDILSSML